MKTVSPVFEVSTRIADLMADRTKVEVLVSSAVCGGADYDYEFTGEFRQRWLKTTVGEIACNFFRDLDLRDCDPETFERCFGWNPTGKGRTTEESDVLYDSLPGDWREVYYKNSPEQWTLRNICVESAQFNDEEGGGWIAILTPKDARIMRDDAWAKKLQDRASHFCARHKVEIATFQFFNVLSREIRQLKDKRDSFFGGEASAERYATYRACGSGSYYEDNDYMSDRLSKPIHELQELMRFCRVKLPLQYALWRESRIKPK